VLGAGQLDDLLARIALGVGGVDDGDSPGSASNAAADADWSFSSSATRPRK
jgi:hypothetical protein